MTSTLVRPASGGMIGGVCAAIARRFAWSPSRVRLFFVLSCALPGPQVLVYVALWVIIPSER